MSKYDDGTFQVSHTEVSTFLQCRRKWMLAYHRKLQSASKSVRVAPNTGTMVHNALEAFYVNGGIANEDEARRLGLDVLQQERADLLRDFPDDASDIDECFLLAEAVFESYIHWLLDSGADVDYEFMASEEKLSMPGPVEGTVLNGRIDLLTRHIPTGDPTVMDFKIVQSINDMIRMLHMNTQAKFYGVLAREKFKRPIRVAFSMMKRNKRTRTVKGPQEERYVIALNNEQLDVYWRQLNGLLKDMIRTQRLLDEGHDHQTVCPPAPSSDCSWKCEFFAVCPLMDDPRSDADWMFREAYEIKTFNHRQEEEENTDDGVSV